MIIASYVVVLVSRLSLTSSLLTWMIVSCSCSVHGWRQHRVDIELVNEDQECLQCTLWGDFADNLMSYMASHKSGPVVIILQWCKA
ncbi:hypothetical protein K1719_047359 [Acacia pycnantha]|nr:hypothetical protein K1719_047359 [Acacia pycnantha]